MVGGSWQWSPAKITLETRRIGIQQAASSACAASSMKCAELLTFEQSVAAAYERAGYDAGLAEELGIDADLQFGGAFLEAFQFLVEPFISPFPVGAEVADGLADAPQEGIVGMRLEAPLVGEGEHLIVDARGIADAQDVDAPVDEFLGYPVDGHVALGADQYLVFAAECLVDSLDEGGGFAGAWRTVDDGHILGS